MTLDKQDDRRIERTGKAWVGEVRGSFVVALQDEICHEMPRCDMWIGGGLPGPSIERRSVPRVDGSERVGQGEWSGIRTGKSSSNHELGHGAPTNATFFRNFVTTFFLCLSLRNWEGLRTSPAVSGWTPHVLQEKEVANVPGLPLDWKWALANGSVHLTI